MHEIKCPNCGKTFTLDEAGYAAIQKQVRDDEFNRDLSERLHQYTVEKENALKLAAATAQQEKTAALDKQRDEINALNLKVRELELGKELAVKQALEQQNEKISAQDKQITELMGKISVAAERSKADIQTLTNDYETKLRNKDDAHAAEIRLKDETIAQYKDFKAKMSVKLLGETLEQHCMIEFERLRATAFRRAKFDKDNDSKTGSEGEVKGSKGDFIFRDYDENGNEYISIMFDMKNESDETSTKHKNEDFLKKLDEDRRKKNCEYAVLVSLLERDSELYNGGIVDVSHKYPKMFVIRPQCFIPMITLLRDAAQSTIEYRQQVIKLQQASIDVSNFENAMNTFKAGFSETCRKAGNQYDAAVKDIDATIKKLQDIKESLRKWVGHLGAAENKLEDLTIKKLTADSPTLRAQFNAARSGNPKSIIDIKE
ncbi:MAG: DUF2130 domain-containing protein [Alphaproteobacteria bacterium]|nr:DUF2130 domain-containing protein [Alphaproteobacteria bacterium]